MNEKQIKKWLKDNFPEIWGMSYDEFEKRIFTPEMKKLVTKLRQDAISGENDK